MNNDQIAPTDELPADVLQVVDRIRATSVPQDSVDRSLVRAVELAGRHEVATVRGSSAGSRASLRRWALWLGMPASLAAATIVLIVTLLPSPPTLAQSLSATRSQPWLHGVVTYAQDGNKSNYVFWFSAAKHVYALKLNESCVFIRFGESLQDNTVETYDQAAGEIRTQEDVELREQDLQLLRTLLAPDAPAAFGGVKAIEPLRPGYDRYRVALKGDGGGAEHVISVSHASGLLDSWQTQRANGLMAVIRFEYPRSGPESISELRTMNGRPTEKKADPVQLRDVKPENAGSARQLDIKPKQGVGAIRFGSSVAQVRDVLGEPTKEKPMGASAREMVYADFGLVLLVHNKLGVGDIQCCSNNFRYSAIYGVTMKTFPGKTKEGIGIGSTREELIAAYGEPTSSNPDGSIGYASQVIGYEFIDGRISRLGMRARSSNCVTSETTSSRDRRGQADSTCRWLDRHARQISSNIRAPRTDPQRPCRLMFKRILLPTMFAPIALVLISPLLCAQQTGQEIIFQEDFADIALPAWHHARPKSVKFSRTPGPDGVAALMMEATEPTSSILAVRLPVDRIAGRAVLLDAWRKAEGVKMGLQHFYNAKSMLSWKGRSESKRHYCGTLYSDFSGTFDWERHRFVVNMPEDLQDATVSIGMQECTGKASWARLTVSVDERFPNQQALDRFLAREEREAFAKLDPSTLSVKCLEGGIIQVFTGNAMCRASIGAKRFAGRSWRSYHERTRRSGAWTVASQSGCREPCRGAVELEEELKYVSLSGLNDRVYEIASLRERTRQIETGVAARNEAVLQVDGTTALPVSPLIFGNNINTQNPECAL